MSFIVTVSDLAKYPDIATAITNTVRKFQESQHYATMIDHRKYFLGENPSLERRWNKLRLDTGSILNLKPKQKIVGDTFKLIVKKIENRLMYHPIQLDDESKYAMLGKRFHPVTADILNDTCISGVGWGHWAGDHVIQFLASEYIPILDDDTGEMVMGIRFTQLAPDRPIKYQIFEPDGVTAWTQAKQGGKLEESQGKTPYRYVETPHRYSGTQITDAQNYGKLPIVAMYCNRERRSLLTPPIKTKINALDFLKTIYVSEVAQSKFIYWLISGYGGQAEELLAIKETAQMMGIIRQDGQDVTIDAKVLEPPYNAHKYLVEALEDEIYHDAAVFNPAKVAGSAHIATAIEAGQRPEDMNVNGVKREVEDYVKGFFPFANIPEDTKVIFTPYRMIDEGSVSTRLQNWADRGVPIEELIKIEPLFSGMSDEIITAMQAKTVGMDKVTTESVNREIERLRAKLAGGVTNDEGATA